MGTELQTVESSTGIASVGFGKDTREFVTMRVGEQLFGVSVNAVQDVLRKQKITRVPRSKQVIAGSLNLRGRIVTAIDMRTRLSLSAIENRDKTMNVVVEYNNELFSLMVDSVGEVLSLSMENFEKTPPNLDDSWRELAAGIFRLEEELLVIVDVKHLLKF
jgi:purine-binding chemotaxis protein CheW